MGLDICQSGWRFKVSIPFKRESLSKANKMTIPKKMAIVSIPFKRESLSKVTSKRIPPQNPHCVSIPFKRESLSKGRCLHIPQRPRNRCFNSLQTGKPIQSNAMNVVATPKVGFNSLQTGKPIQRHYKSLTQRKIAKFQFPSNGKAYPKNELQAKNNELTQIKMFQFPSNGKAYPKSIPLRTSSPERWSFNSLQTGKPIQRKLALQEKRKVYMFQFPSNGKADPKPTIYEVIMARHKFQFPSNGKADPKHF